MPKREVDRGIVLRFQSSTQRRKGAEEFQKAKTVCRRLLTMRTNCAGAMPCFSQARIKSGKKFFDFGMAQFQTLADKNKTFSSRAKAFSKKPLDARLSLLKRQLRCRCGIEPAQAR